MFGILEKIALVQCYIHHVKGVEVNITPPTNLNQINKLNKAYKVAKEYFN